MTPLAWMDVISSDIDRTLEYYAAMFGWSAKQFPLDHGEGPRRPERPAIVAAPNRSRPSGARPHVDLMVEGDDARP